MSDMSPPLHNPYVTPTSPQPDSFPYSWDLVQHCKGHENGPKTIPAQTKQITFISYYARKIKQK